MNYFGSANSRLIEQDFTREQRRDFTIRKEILWESEIASDVEVNLKELEYIQSLKANDPTVGYNRWPSIRSAPTIQLTQPAPVPCQPYAKANSGV